MPRQSRCPRSHRSAHRTSCEGPHHGWVLPISGVQWEHALAHTASIGPAALYGAFTLSAALVALMTVAYPSPAGGQAKAVPRGRVCAGVPARSRLAALLSAAVRGMGELSWDGLCCPRNRAGVFHRLRGDRYWLPLLLAPVCAGGCCFPGDPPPPNAISDAGADGNDHAAGSSECSRVANP